MKFFLSLSFLLAGFACVSQINGFAKVTAISGTSLTVSNVNQTNGNFAVGQQVVIIQMQGADITGNTANNASFGTLNSLNSAGLYEVGIVSSINGATTQIVLTSALVNTYNTAGSIQIVTFPQLGTTNFSTTSNFTCTSWNGNVGGVIAFRVNGNLNLFHSISANGNGFRGGTVSGDDGSGCETATFINAAGNARYANKGEGVYITAAAEKAGRAKAVNGGGGGIVHNGGGGGGGNLTAGGNGYYGYTGGGYCSSTTDAGGQGGLAISSSGSRVFMGGGGGAGQQNNGLGSSGGNGGGIILIKCDTIVASGSCSAQSIRSNGETAANGGNDGCGGGGAGGSIVLNVKGIRAIAACGLTISANGGGGGNVNNGGSHGAGGGGGQGAIFIPVAGPFANTTINTNNGTGGSANNGGSAPTASAGAGSSGAGIFTGASTGALPIELIYFKAQEIDYRTAQLEWQTASEINNKLYAIFHSSNGGDWKLIGTKSGAGTSSSVNSYSFKHYTQSPTNYYRLKQVDYDHTYKFSPIVYLSLEDHKLKVKAYPNPTSGEIIVECDHDLSYENLYLTNSLGQKLNVEPVKLDNQRYQFNLSNMPKGIYFLYSQTITEKIILK